MWLLRSGLGQSGRRPFKGEQGDELKKLVELEGDLEALQTI